MFDQSKYNYGILIRLNREYQNMNLKTLSELSGISLGQLSKIERGIETATNDTLSYIFETLDINYELLKNEMPYIIHLFSKLYSSVYYFEEKENAKKILDEINEKYYSEFKTVETILANLIYNLTYQVDLNSAKEYIHYLFNLIDFFTLSQKQMFYDYSGIYHKLRNRIDKAIYYYKLSIEINDNPMITAMANYHLGIAYRKKHQILKSYACIDTSKTIFFSTNNFRRSMMTDLVIANLHSENGEIDETISLLYKCLENYKRIQIPKKEISRIYFNIIWNNILRDNYTEANKVLNSLDDDVLDILNQNIVFIIYRIILLIEFDKHDEALQLCLPIRRNFIEDDIDHNFILYYYYLIKDNKSKRLKHLNKIKTLILQSSSYIDLRFLFKLLDKECTTSNQLMEFKDLLMNYVFNSFDE